MSESTPPNGDLQHSRWHHKKGSSRFLYGVLRYGLAVVSIALAMLLRFTLELPFGKGLPTFITFYPFLMLTALLGGFGPGLVATTLTLLVVDIWVYQPVGQLTLSKITPVELVGYALFACMGLFICTVAELYRRSRTKAAAYDREQALAQSRKEKEFFADLLQNAEQPFAIGYPDGSIPLFNRAFETLTGYTTQELRTIDWATTLTPPEWHDPELRKLEEIKATGKPVRYEKEYIRKDGSRVPIELLTHIGREYESNRVYYYAFITDLSERRKTEAKIQQHASELQVVNNELRESRLAALNLAEDADLARKRAEEVSRELYNEITERKQAESALRKSEQRFRALATASFAVVYRMSPDWSEMKQLSGKDFLIDTIEPKRNWLQGYIPPEEQSHVLDAINQAIGTRSIFELEHRVIQANGRIGWVFSHAVPIFEEDGEISEWFGAAQDITERKLAEQNLRHRTEELTAANRDLESFSYSVSHDLQNPLGIIGGFTNILIEDYAEKIDKEGQDFLWRISDGVKRMQALIKDMLALSRIGRQEVHRENVNLSAIARNYLQELENSEPQRKVELDVPYNIHADADPRLIHLALENLLRNAWKFTSKKEKTHIEFGTVHQDGSTVFFIRDNGVGFDMQAAQKIFEPFKRVHKEKEFGGTGVGLSIVQRVIERHGGKVWAEGKVGEGATFYFTLGSSH